MSDAYAELLEERFGSLRELERERRAKPPPREVSRRHRVLVTGR